MTQNSQQKRPKELTRKTINDNVAIKEKNNTTKIVYKITTVNTPC